MRAIIAAVLAVATALTPAVSGVPRPYRLCAHAPFTGAEPIPGGADRIGGFYFDYVNAELGGIDGHRVEFVAHDDGYYPAGARAAAERCARGGTDVLVGIHGVDQIASTAAWSDQKHVPYIHWQASELVLARTAWSAMFAPSDERMMRGLADTLVTSSPREAVYGLVRVDSPFWEAGSRAFARRLGARGSELSADVPLQKDETQFSNAWRELSSAGVTHLVLHLPPILMIKFLSQRPQTSEPTLAAIDPFGSTEASARAAGDLPFLAFSSAGPLYDPDDRRLPWHAEMKEFRRIFRTYAEGAGDPNESDWFAYLRAKQLHRFLDHLDEDLAPATIRQAFSSYVEADPFPSCRLDFSGRPRLGGLRWHMERLIGGSWQASGGCTRARSVDLVVPLVHCGPPVIVGSEVRCVAEDPSGIRSITVHVTDRLGRSGSGTKRARCDRRVAVNLTLVAPGVHSVEATARDCSGLTESAGSLVVSPGRVG